MCGTTGDHGCKNDANPEYFPSHQESKRGFKLHPGFFPRLPDILVKVSLLLTAFHRFDRFSKVVANLQLPSWDFRWVAWLVRRKVEESGRNPSAPAGKLQISYLQTLPLGDFLCTWLVSDLYSCSMYLEHRRHIRWPFGTVSSIPFSGDVFHDYTMAWPGLRAKLLEGKQTNDGSKRYYHPPINMDQENWEFLRSINFKWKSRSPCIAVFILVGGMVTCLVIESLAVLGSMKQSKFRLQWITTAKSLDEWWNAVATWSEVCMEYMIRSQEGLRTNLTVLMRVPQVSPTNMGPFSSSGGSITNSGSCEGFRWGSMAKTKQVATVYARAHACMCPRPYARAWRDLQKFDLLSTFFNYNRKHSTKMRIHHHPEPNGGLPRTMMRDDRSPGAILTKVPSCRALICWA